MNEVWKVIEGYEGRYKVSNLGRIANQKNKILYTRLNNSGYIVVRLIHTRGKKGTWKTIHRLVAREFVVGYHENLQVNHKDGNRENNVATNLEWVTAKENIRDCIERGTFNIQSAHAVARIKRKKKVEVFNLNNESLGIFDSMREASIKFQLSESKCSLVANGKRKHHKGFIIQFIL